ncbi:MAG: hypothetical protein Q9218_004606 [Villophora microphyllina]
MASHNVEEAAAQRRCLEQFRLMDERHPSITHPSQYLLELQEFHQSYPHILPPGYQHAPGPARRRRALSAPPAAPDQAHASKLDTPFPFSKLPAEIRFTICKNTSAIHTSADELPPLGKVSGIADMTNLMLVSKQMRQDVLESSIRDDRFSIHTDDHHTTFLSKRLGVGRLPRYTPPAYFKHIKNWTVHFRFGNSPMMWSKNARPRYPCPGRMFSWICNQLAHSEAEIRSISIMVHDPNCTQNFKWHGKEHPYPPLVEYRKGLLILALRMLASRIRVTEKLEVVGAEYLLGTNDWRNCPELLGSSIERPVFCAVEEDWNAMRERAAPHCVTQHKVQEQLYGLWYYISDPDSFFKFKGNFERTLSSCVGS